MRILNHFMLYGYIPSQKSDIMQYIYIYICIYMRVYCIRYILSLAKLHYVLLYRARLVVQPCLECQYPAFKYPDAWLLGHCIGNPCPAVIHT